MVFFLNRFGNDETHKPEFLTNRRNIEK